MNLELEKIFNTQTINFCPYNNDKEVIVYGAGQMGVDASNCLKKSGVNVKNFADKNEKIIGTKVNCISVRHPECFTSEEKESYLFAIAVVTVSYNLLYDYLKSLGCKHICFVGDLVNKTTKDEMVSNTWRLINPTENELRKISKIYDNSFDTRSQRALIQSLEWFVNNIEKRNFLEVESLSSKFFIPEVKNLLRDDDTFVFYDFLCNDPITRLEEDGIRFKKVYIISPVIEPSSDEKIVKYRMGLGNENSYKSFVNADGLTVKSRFVDGISNLKYQIRRLDDYVKTYSYLCIYGLGLTLDVLKGAIDSILNNRPIIAVAIHHTRSDFVEIPDYLIDKLQNYSFFIRLHSYCGFEIVFYAIPKERFEQCI